MNIRNIRTKYINVKKDTTKAEQMNSLLEESGFTDYERFDAVTDVPDNLNYIKKESEWFRTHMCGLSHRKLLQETIMNDGEPILILEDDIDIEEDHIKYEISIPKDADCIYFGTSHGDNNYSAINVGNDWLKVDKIYAAHAILYINPRYSAAACSIIEFCILIDVPFDSFGLAYHLQKHFNVYAPRLPFFYQSDRKNNNPKYNVEAVTRPRLLTDNEKEVSMTDSGIPKLMRAEGTKGDRPKVQTGKQKIALCMIVKNEEAIITRCFDSVKRFIDYYVICDTGSTDNTIKVIKDYWEEHGVEGEVHERPWVNFAHNRTEVLNYASGAPVDLLMTLDADEVIVPIKDGVVKLDEEVLTLPYMGGDLIYIITVNNNLHYSRPQFLKKGLSWRWEEPVHEFCWAPDAKTTQHLEDICCNAFHDGGRSLDPNKFKRDSIVFETHILDNPKHWRSYFYLAQSYNDAGEPEKALKPLEVAIENCAWDEEKFIARLRKARYRRATGCSMEEVLADYLEAYNFMPSRAEPLHDLLVYYRDKGDWNLVILFGEKALSIPRPPVSSLFVEYAIYDWKIKDELALAYYYTGRYSDARKLSQEITEAVLMGKISDEDSLSRIKINTDHYNNMEKNVFQKK